MLPECSKSKVRSWLFDKHYTCEPFKNVGFLFKIFFLRSNSLSNFENFIHFERFLPNNAMISLKKTEILVGALRTILLWYFFFTCMWLVTYICKMLLPLIKKLYKNFAMLEYLFHLFISFCSIINFQNKYNHHFMNNVLIIWQSSGTSSKGKRILQYQVCCVLPQKEKFPISSVGDIFLFQTSTYPVVDTYILGIARILQLWPGSLQIRKGNPGKWDLGKVVNLWELFVNV